MPHHVFLSYSPEDADIAQPVRDDLRADGLTVWIGADNDTPGTETTIRRAIEAASCMVVILSPDGAQSPQVKENIDAAVAKSIPILPTIVRGDEWSAIPRMFVGKRTYDLRANYPKQIKKLAAGIRKIVEAP